MRLWHLVVFSFIWIGGILAYKFWPEESIAHAPGVLVSEPPQQQVIERGHVWTKNGYTITALAKFTVSARVLHRKLYSSGRETDLSPIDLALGWGRMSDQQILDEITITQRNRWYFWRAATLPIPRQEIVSSSSNMHMIPARTGVEDSLKSIREGDLIHVSGYLVAASAADGWKWRSSLSRTDTGNGSCEIIWVEKINVSASY